MPKRKTGAAASPDTTEEVVLHTDQKKWEASMLGFHAQTRNWMEKDDKKPKPLSWKPGKPDGTFNCYPKLPMVGNTWNNIVDIGPDKTKLYLSDLAVIQAILLLPGKNTTDTKDAVGFSPTTLTQMGASKQCVSPQGKPEGRYYHLKEDHIEIQRALDFIRDNH